MAARVRSAEALDQALDAFEPARRRQALAELARDAALPPTGTNVNLHLHSFFSYNAAGLSPTHLAWAARRAGLYAAGLCDFDVLDGLEEFLDAGLTLGLRVTVNLETRAYLREYARAEINSPGEPGVTYIMGAGFSCVPAAGTAEAAVLRRLRDQAGERNRALVRRINPHLGPAATDYAGDVLPLSPGGCPTERHIVRACVNKAAAVFPAAADRTRFWAGILGRPEAEVAPLLTNAVALEERVRARLVKRGGLGYEQPTERTFPAVDDFVAWVLACGAIPLVTWLDGTSEGERDPGAMLECLRAKGAAAVNIIPDRNWNIPDPAARAVKTARLREFVGAAESLGMPVNIGTEMNREGLPFVDDLDGEALRPYREVFLRGARVMVGHSLLARYAGYAYTGPAAAAEYGDVRARNRCFASVGALTPLTRAMAERLERMGERKALDAMRKAATEGRWPT